MMELSAIRQMPTVLVVDGHRIGESLVRSFFILDKAIDLLKRNTPADVVLEIIRDLKESPAIESKIKTE